MDESKPPHYSQRIESLLEACLPSEQTEPARLHQAMRYAVLSPGKRVRPRLVYAAAEVLGVPATRVDAAAAAVECIHAYSLVHDDLPGMDDDELRRGRATTHIAFDEATAILAGDGLQSLAFEILTAHSGLEDDPAARDAQLATLARAIGSRGMVGGQMLDMAAENRSDVDLEDLQQIHDMKTGALLAACVTMVADAATDLTQNQREALDIFTSRIGLAFQVRDDILDIESSTEKLGKTQGADLAHDKATYPALLGLDQAKQLAERLYTEAINALTLFDNPEPLQAMAAEIVKRDH